MAAKKIMNRTHIEGFLYQHNLQYREGSKKNPDVPFIMGTIDIATDEEITNIVPIHFSYVTAKTSKGKDNSAFPILMNIINKTYKSVMEHGKDNATKFTVDSAIGLNEFFIDGDDGQLELVSAKRNEGGFIRVTNELEADKSKRSTFKCDMIITGARHIDADDERELPEKCIVKGYTFDFRSALLPVEFSVTHPAAISYFEGLEASEREPFYTNVSGQQISEVIVRKIEEESAFGEASVREVRRTRKDFVINWSAKEPYLWDDEGSITAAEMKKLLAEREIYKATLKSNRDEWLANRNKPAAVATASDDDFNF